MATMVRDRPWYRSGGSWLVIGAVLVMIIVMIVSGVRIHHASIARDQAVLDRDQAVSSVAQAKEKTTEQKGQLQLMASGGDARRQQKDDDLISSLMDTAGTWSSSKEYREAREKVKGYALPQSSNFLDTFMPEETECMTDREGKEYCSIDTEHKNSTFDSLDSVVTKVSGGTYSYFGLAKMTIFGGEGTTTRYSPLQYSIDSSGKITELRAYASVSSPITVQ